jgi:hypothetical protein
MIEETECSGSRIMQGGRMIASFRRPSDLLVDLSLFPT